MNRVLAAIKLKQRALRNLVLFVILAVCAVAQTSRTFRLPSDMHLFESAAATVDETSERSLLKNAIERTLHETEDSCDTKSRATFANAEVVHLPPRLFGAAFLVRIDKSCVCGVTGNCPIFVYVRNKMEYRKVLTDSGWGFSLALATRKQPAIILASHVSAVETRLVLWRFENGHFVRHGCDAVFPKGDNWTALWNTKEMSVKSCVEPANE